MTSSNPDRIAAARKGLEAMEFLFALGDICGHGSPEVQSVRDDVRRDLFAALDAGITPADVQAAARRIAD
jgi:hypothetical protein